MARRRILASSRKPQLERTPNPLLEYELLALNTTGATYRVRQGSPVIFPLCFRPPLSPESLAKVSVGRNPPPCATELTESQLPSPGPNPDRTPDSLSTSSSFLDLNPGKLSWFQSPVKKPPTKRVRYTSAERREASRKRRAECPYVDTTLLLTALERERLWGHDLLYRWSSQPSPKDVLPQPTPIPDSQSDADASDKEDFSIPPQETSTPLATSTPRKKRIVVIRALRRRRPIILSDSNACDYVITVVLFRTTNSINERLSLFFSTGPRGI